MPVNFRRNRPRHGRTARENSSDWRYPQIVKGSAKRSSASVKRAFQHILIEEKEYASVVDLPS